MSNKSLNRSLIEQGVGKSDRRKIRKNVKSTRNKSRKLEYAQMASKKTHIEGVTTVAGVRKPKGKRHYFPGLSPWQEKKIELSLKRIESAKQRSPSEQLKLLDQRLGVGMGAIRERQKLARLLE